MLLWNLNRELQVKFSPVQVEFRVHFFFFFWLGKAVYTIVLSFILFSQITSELIVLLLSNVKC